MPSIHVTKSADASLKRLPTVVSRRVLEIFERLKRWPEVSGVKPLRRNLRGNFRVRTGAYRVLFRVDQNEDMVVVWRIDDRRDVYEE